MAEQDKDSQDRELAMAQLDSADDEALAGTKEDIKTEVFDFFKDKFHVAEELGALPSLMWAAASDKDEDDPQAFSAVYAMLEDVIHPADWKRFLQHGLKNKAKIPHLMEAVDKAMEVITGNPTEEDTGSSGGAGETTAPSKAGSSRRARTSTR